MIEFGNANELPAVEVDCPAAVFENAIRTFGVVAACEWFGHAHDSDFTRETVRALFERSNGPVSRRAEAPDQGESGSRSA